jgi:enoyl-CoA hydratase
MADANGDRDLLVDRVGGLLRLTLNRPNKANAITIALLERIGAVIEEAGQDPSVHALVLTGAGGRVFSAGADLAELRHHMSSADGTRNFDAAWSRTARTLRTAPVFSVAALNGICAGGGVFLAACCDFRLAVSDARIFYPVLANCVIPSSDAMERMIALLGRARAKALLLSGIELDAALAMTWGLVEMSVARDSLEEVIAQVVAPALVAPRSHLATLKQMCV